MKKLLAVILAIVMTFSMVSTVVVAVDETATTQGSLSDVYDSAKDAIDAAGDIKDSIDADDCGGTISNTVTFAKALAIAVHKLVHTLSEMFDFRCPFCKLTNTEVKPSFSVTAETVADAEWYDEEATTLSIDDASDFLAFMETAYTWYGVADRVNVPTFKGKTIVLNADVYLPDGYIWTPISCYDSLWMSNGGFQGTFDGQGYTIYNLNTTHENKTGRGYRLGLFGEVGDGAVFKNLTLDGANTFGGNSSAGALCAHAAGNVTFENITVKNSTIRQGRYSGGILGSIADVDNSTITFKNCTVKDTALFNVHNDYCGALYGANYGYDNDTLKIVIEDCTVKNVVKNFYAGSFDEMRVITLEEALTKYADQPAGLGGN